MLKKNEIYKTEILDISNEGSGVCRIDGFTVFVPDTAVGDIADVRIVKALKSYGYGIIENLIVPSPYRAENDCGVYKKCGGCCYRHMTYEEECRVKLKQVKDAFRRIGGFDIEAEGILAAESIYGYRNKAQLPVSAGEMGAAAGFFAKRSHRLIECADCALTPKIFGEITKEVLRFLNEHKIKPYDEQSGKGLVRHIYLRTSGDLKSIMLCLVCTSERLPEKEKFAACITEKFPEIKTVVINVNSRRTNVILGGRSITLCGEGYITDTMCGNKVRISPQSFYQVNLRQAQRLYRKAEQYAGLAGGETLLDLYCGIGTIGLSMAKSVRKLIGVEIVPQAVENARINARINGIENSEFFCGDCSDAAKRFESEGLSPDVAILDPPRKGCDGQVIESVAAMAPKKVVMISCNPATAARDCKLICGKGYRLERFAAVDMFPRTAHCECVVLMTRA
ncbi:MAG: 23S rRNA (uracil(1939)-C(5))-methyltransferase RlmD [Clostridia bacterium]|nr:23S rRNA (uracil(1939)-C(5))-methyltransferase RlmD [Clostridia bacterium]